MTFPIGTCPSCGGKRIWIDRGFRPFPKWGYIHKRGCVAGKRWTEEDQRAEAIEFGVCPVHGTEQALNCQWCYEIADRDDWTPESEFEHS